jgi:hypothetical protein
MSHKKRLKNSVKIKNKHMKTLERLPDLQN